MIGDIQNYDVKQVLPLAVRGATYGGPDFDMSHYLGPAKAILAAEAQGSDVTLNVKFQASDPAALGGSYNETGDTDKALNKETSGKTKIAVQFTQSGARSIKRVALRLKKTGTIASDKLLTLTIETDSSGAPSGTALGTATILANSVGATYDWYDFVFTAPVDVANSTVYHLVLTSNYTASDTNYISWQGLTVASGGNAEDYTTWTDITTLNLLYRIFQYNFADIPGAAFTEVGNAAAFEAIHFPVADAKRIVRAVATVAGGTATGNSSCVMLAHKRFA
ncbi:MAG: hypothetical protein QM256_01750 [Pseudomonadota bacterium]|nr:hypothetical protein [Pseudomonadota bacterium]